MRSNTRLFVILLSGGLVGILSLLLIDLDALLKILPLPADTQIPMSMPVLKVVSLIQPAILVAVAVLVGVGLAAKVGLSSPVAEATANRGDVSSALKSQIVPGILGGFAGGVLLVFIASALKPFLSAEMLTRLGEFGSILPIPTRLLYGGITEEILLRWGLMTLLVWIAWRLFQKGKDRPGPVSFIVAILVSSIVFAIGHFPFAFMLFPQPTFALILFVLLANSAFGLIGGYLFWSRGLESAMIAHALTHLVMFTASYIGVYF
jgi:membrane protease YdiL (CAAX protease family)